MSSSNQDYLQESSISNFIGNNLKNTTTDKYSFVNYLCWFILCSFFIFICITWYFRKKITYRWKLMCKKKSNILAYKQI